MKLLFISTMNGYSWGGSEELWFETALFAKSQGKDVEAVVFKNDPIHPKFSRLEKMGIRVHFVEKEKVVMPNLIKRGTLKVLNRPVNIKYENRFSFISSLNPDEIILSQGGCTDITYYNDLKDFFKIWDRPFVVVNHYNKENGKLQPEQREYLKLLFNRSKATFFVGERNRSVLERQLAQKIDRSQIIRNPVPLDINKVPRLESAKPSFAVVGRLDVSDKGQDILLECISASKWKARDFIINLYGEGKDELFLKDLIHFYGLEKRVFIKGHVNNKTEIWGNNDMLLLPSISEGFPITIVEAMLCGRPCLVTDVGDSGYLIEDNVNGWVAQCSSVNSLDEALERAWRQKEIWNQMGERACEKAKELNADNAAKVFYEKIIKAAGLIKVTNVI